MEPAVKKINWFGYINAWLAYAGAFLTQASKITDVIRGAFNNIKPPKKDDFISRS